MLARSAYPITRTLILALMVLTAGGLLGCRHAAADLALTESDVGRTFHVTAGATVTLSVTSSGSIPYSWTLKTLEGDALAAAGTKSASNGPPVPGNTETTVYSFRAVKPGQAKICMDYMHREGPSFFTNPRTFTVIVDSAP